MVANATFPLGMQQLNEASGRDVQTRRIKQNWASEPILLIAAVKPMMGVNYATLPYQWAHGHRMK